jgi:uncharacterized protein (TIGR02300 family)
MPAKDLGTKYVCFKCGTKFYDLKKPEPLCPKCGADQRESPALKPAPEKRRAAAPRPVEPAAAEEAEAPEAAEEADDAEEDAEAADDDEP